MDFWARLLGATASPPPTAPPIDISVQQRLIQFKREYTQTLQISNKASTTKSNVIVFDTIAAGIHRLTSLLETDTRSSAPQLVEFATSTFVYKAISRIALSLKDGDVSREAVAFFNALIDTDAENLLGTDQFALTLNAFVNDLLDSNWSANGSEIETEILELVFTVIAKLRQQPDLLPAWFSAQSEEERASERPVSDTLFEAPIQERDFPLCRPLIGRVHNGGKIGDFARTSLLYLFEAAPRSLLLQRWIINSELSTMMASSVGALYSQLSRKVTIAHPEHELPLIVAVSEERRPCTPPEAESFHSERFQARLATFISCLMFWQDCLHHCHSAEIKQTLIYHYRIIFLEQVLYPSLLQSSDMDGGSSVAVLTYCSRLLETVNHPDLIRLILHYLLDLSSSSDLSPATVGPAIVGKRSQAKLTEAKESIQQAWLNPSFFSLIDLLQAGVKSLDRDTVIASLRLVTVILTHHHSYGLPSLFHVTTLSSSRNCRAFGALDRELGILLALAEEVAGKESMDEAYAVTLKDASAMIESYSCSKLHPAVGSSVLDLEHETRYAVPEHGCKDIYRQHIDVRDPFLTSLFSLLERFFLNDVETNLILTEVLTRLASCPCVRLEAWLVVNPSKYREKKAEASNVLPRNSMVDEDTTLDEDERMENTRLAGLKSSRDPQFWSEEDEPVLVKILRTLVRQLRTARASIREFDSLVASRKRAFQGAVKVEDEMAGSAPSPLTTLTSKNESRRQSGLGSNTPNAGSKTPNQPSVASSPRGWMFSATVGQQRVSSWIPKARETPRSSGRTSSSPGFPTTPQSPSKNAKKHSPHSLRLSSEEGEPVPNSFRSQPTKTPPRLDHFKQKLEFGSFGNTEAAPASYSGCPNDSDACHDDFCPDHQGRVSRTGEANLSHVLTNVVILQEFVLELAAVIHVRAGLLYHEIKFV